MPILIYLNKSPKKDKKYVAVFRNPTKTIHFGSANHQDYTIHKNYNRKMNYIARHKVNEDWSNPLTAGSLSRYVLWNKTDLTKSIDDYIKRFNIEDRRTFKL